MGEGRNFHASSQKSPVSKYCSSSEVVPSTTAPKEHESTSEGHFSPSRKMGRGSLRPPRGTEEWQKKLPWTPPPHSDPTPAPRRPLGNRVSRCRRVAGAPHGPRPWAKRHNMGQLAVAGSTPGRAARRPGGAPMSPNVTD